MKTLAFAALAAAAFHSNALAQSDMGRASAQEPPLEVEIALEDCLDGARAPRATSYALGACDYALSQPASDRLRAGLLANRGVILYKRGDFAGARADLEDALALAPDLAEASLNLSAVLIRLDDPARAAAEAGRALDRGLRDAWRAHFNRAVALETLGRIEAARAAYEEAAALNPDEPLLAAQAERLPPTPPRERAEPPRLPD